MKNAFQTDYWVLFLMLACSYFQFSSGDKRMAPKIVFLLAHDIRADRESGRVSLSVL
jgi:hypothetical protein